MRIRFQERNRSATCNDTTWHSSADAQCEAKALLRFEEFTFPDKTPTFSTIQQQVGASGARLGSWEGMRPKVLSDRLIFVRESQLNLCLKDWIIVSVFFVWRFCQSYCFNSGLMFESLNVCQFFPQYQFLAKYLSVFVHQLAVSQIFVSIFVSSEGALYVILPYDYQAQHPLFEHTPVLNQSINIYSSKQPLRIF